MLILLIVIILFNLKINYRNYFPSFNYRNSIRRDNFACEGKCRYDAICFLRKGHHNATLCNHLFPSYDSNMKRNPYESPVGRIKPTVTNKEQLEQQQQQLYTEIMMFLRKKLRSFILKRFLQLFIFPPTN